MQVCNVTSESVVRCERRGEISARLIRETAERERCGVPGSERYEAVKTWCVRVQRVCAEMRDMCRCVRREQKRFRHVNRCVVGQHVG